MFEDRDFIESSNGKSGGETRASLRDANGPAERDERLSTLPIYLRELGQVAKETGTAIEINGGANLRNPAYSESYVKEYVVYLSILAEEGVQFAMGSDAHDIGRLGDIESVWDVVEQLGLSADRIWRPACSPIVGG